MSISKKKLLLVEDESIIAMDQVRQLRRQGYTVIHAYCGEEAIEKVKSAKPPVDLILMDVNLGDGIDGTETAQAILKDHDIPVVFLSSHTDPEVVEKTEKITSYGYVVKDSGITVLDASIKMAFKLHAAHQTIKHTNESLRLAQAASRAGTWDWDVVNNIFSWSPEFLNLFGMPADAIPGFESWAKAVHPDDREIAESRIRESIEKKTELMNDYRILLPSGEVRWIRATGKTYYSNERPLRMLGLCIDITEMKQAENQILRTLESIRDGFLALDKDWNFIYINNAAERILGINRDETIGENHWKVFPLTLGTMLEEEYRLAASGEVRDFENYYEPWHRWFHISCFPREGGGISVYFQEITARKNAERKVLHQTSVLYGINKIFKFSISSESEKELGELCMKVAEEATGSKFGFICEIKDTEKPVFLAENIFPGIFGSADQDFKNSDFKEIYERVAGEGKGFFINKSSPGTINRSVPQGPGSLNSILCVPLKQNSAVIGIICVCGNIYGYTDDDLESLETIAPSVAEAFQRKRLEQELRISEEKMRNLIKFAPAGIYEIDFKRPRFKNVNDVICQYLGYTREELLSINPFDILDEEGKHIFRERIAKGLAGEKVDPAVEYKVKSKNGHEYYAVLNVTFTYKDGKPDGAFVIAYDVTERKLAEQALKQSEERFRELVQNTTAVILRVDNYGVIRFANEQALEFFGYKEKELIGRHVVGTIVPEKESTGRNLAEMVNRIMENPDQFHSNINENMCKNGERVWMEWTNSGIYDKDGHLIEFLSVGIDATERIRAEQAFDESRKKYQALIETTNDFIWEIDDKGRYTYCSPQMEKLWGYKPEEMIGKSPFEVMHPEDIENTAKFFMEIADSPTSFSGLSTRFYNNRGNLIYVETSGVPFFDEKGKFMGYRGITRDITERKKAEEQLERSNQKINEILNSIQDDFYVLDRNWNFVFVSRQFTSRIGKEPKDFVGKNIWQMFPKHLGTTYEENCRAGMDKREVRRFEISGKYTDAYYRITVFPSAEGITVLGTDITHQKKIEDAQHEIEEKFRAVFERSTVGKALINTNGIIIEINQAFADMLGYTIEELMNIDSSTISHPEDIETTKEAFRSVFNKERTTHRFEKRCLHKNGSIIRVDISFTLMRDLSGTPLYFIASIVDITERKKAEEALQKALAEKEMLMRELQHRVKNSLSTAVSLIGLEQDNQADERLLAVLSNTETRLRTMAMLYDELNQADSLERIDLSVYLQTVINTLTKAYLSSESHVQIKTSLSPIELEPKRAMPLGLIVNELIINAFKYAFPAGRKGIIKIKLLESGKNVELIVADNGTGFSPPNGLIKSSKLGLKLVEILTEQICGTLNIENEKGVRVSVTFEK